METSKQNTPRKEKFLDAGLIIDDRFQIIEPIRKTSGCIVYRATDLSEKIDKALLMIPPVIQSDFEAMGILKETARNLKWLNHIYIARFYDLHTRGVYNYFEMEFVPGKSIKRKKYENPDKKFTENMVRWIALQVLEGLLHAHSKDLLHKNIKPQKIIFTGSGQVRLIDFGVSGAIRNAMALVRDTTSRSAILFMPPEQLRGKKLTYASDIYSLGATLYYLLESKPPFNHGDIHYQILNELPEPIESVSRELNDIILRCLAKDMNQRYQSCNEMMDEIHNILYAQERKLPETKPPVVQKEQVTQTGPVVQEENEEKPEPARFNEDEYFGEGGSFIKMITEKIKINKSILIWLSAFFIVVISVITYRILFSSDGGKQSYGSAGSSQEEQTNIRMMAALNSAADKLYAKGQFIMPKGNNALEMYLEVLEIDPEDKHATEHIESMKSNLYSDIKDYLADWMLVEAEELLQNCMIYFEDDKRFEKLDEEFEALMKRADSLPLQIEILNGAGKSGIAGTLSKQLKNSGYKIVNTDNYRVNGRVNWQVRKTLLIGSLPKTNRIEKLEKILNLNYKRDKLTHKQYKSANIIVILGNDYKTIPVFKK
jgi:serine/threonine protein kinase